MNAMILSGMLNKITCLKCDLLVMEIEIKTLLQPHIVSRYEFQNIHKRIAESKGKLFYCPKPDCEGILDLANYPMFAV